MIERSLQDGGTDCRRAMRAVLEELIFGTRPVGFVFNEPSEALLPTLERATNDGGLDLDQGVHGTSIAQQLRHLIFSFDLSTDRLSRQFAEEEEPDWNGSWSYGLLGSPGPATTTPDELLAALRTAAEDYLAAFDACDTTEIADPKLRKRAINEMVGVTVHTTYHVSAIRQKLAALQGADASSS